MSVFRSVLFVSCMVAAVAAQATEPIKGRTAVCVGASIQLTNASQGGTWSTADPTVAQIGEQSGVLNGISTGTVIVSYTQGENTMLYGVSVYPAPPNISGPYNVCQGGKTQFTSTPGGVWNSKDNLIANVDEDGNIMGLTRGTTTISYSFGGSCTATHKITVDSCAQKGRMRR